MSHYFDNSDWKKQAAMTATSDADIEKAFSDQASGFVENKLAPLMKSPYSIGFEIIRKNEDNTRMVGAFAFKVEESILLAPVFFLNGDIKGPLLYRTDTRTFVPATKDWAMYMIESLEVDEGNGIDVSRRSDSVPLVQMQRINFLPSSYTKRASAKTSEEGLVNVPVVLKNLGPTPDGSTEIKLPENTEDPAGKWNKDITIRFNAKEDGTIECCCKEATWNLSVKDAAEICNASDAVIINDNYEISKEAALQVKEAFFSGMGEPEDIAQPLINAIDAFMAKPAGVLRDFLSEPGVGEAAIPAIIKAAEADYDFAENLAYLYGGLENFIPEKLTPAEGIQKKASVEELLEIRYDVPDDLTKSASQNYFIDGFTMKDTRDHSKLVTEIEEAPVGIQAPSGPGIYSVLKSDGTFEDNVLVTHYSGIRFGDNDEPCLVSRYDDDISCDPLSQATPEYVLIKDGKIAKGRNILGIQTGNADVWNGYTDKMTAGNVYLIAFPDNVTTCMKINKEKTVDGIQYIDANVSYSMKNAYLHDGDSTGKQLVYNPSLKTSVPAEGIIGGDAKFIKLNRKTEDNHNEYCWEAESLGHFGGMESLDKFIYEIYKMPKVTIKETGEEKKAYVFSCGDEMSAPFTKLAAMVKLTQDMLIPADMAYDMLNKSASAEGFAFYYPGMEKMATNLRIVDRPNFDLMADPAFGIPLDPSRSFRLRIMGDQIMEPASAIGDALDPETASGLPNSTVIATAPEDLRALADIYKLPNVFEHGVVGTLADTFNAIALVEKYIPKLEDAVDALGRILFLIYWCPQDFEKAYGSDDMVNMSAEVDSNFQSSGALLLKLLKKTDRQRRGANDKTVKEDK